MVDMRTKYAINNDCFKVAQMLFPKGIMVHSTGANNPNVSRYVDLPGGSSNHWNKPGLTKCVHGFLGLLCGEIVFYQTLPYNFRGWHAGGPANSTHIGFEICEDGLSDPEYFNKAMNAAQEVCAFLCIKYGLDESKVISHHEGNKLGIASNHADIDHWLKLFNEDMDWFRSCVAKKIKEMKWGEEMTYEQFESYMDKYIYKLAEAPASDWACKANVMERIRELGVSDGCYPRQFATREQVWLMILNALCK